jgi:NAD-dependent DNA ligase
MAITAKITDISRALHVLDGILMGIGADKIINEQEVKALKEWLENHKNLIDVCPFSELYEITSRILENKRIDKADHDELLDFCRNFRSSNGPIDIMTMEMRNLHGFLFGIIADNRISKEELEALRKWMGFHSSNSSKWPFNELDSLIENVLADGIITEEEQQAILSFARGFIEQSVSSDFEKDNTLYNKPWLISNAPTLQTIDQIVERDVKILIIKKTFCFTGQMKAGTRKEVENLLRDKGGFPVDTINKHTDYLVIGALSNPCWAYSTYGRKIELVMNNKETGGITTILHEDDFICALASV